MKAFTLFIIELFAAKAKSTEETSRVCWALCELGPDVAGSRRPTSWQTLAARRTRTDGGRVGASRVVNFADVVIACYGAFASNG